MPRPSATKTLILMVAGCVSAKPRAAPIKGAVQGLATTAASTPVKKEPLRPDFCVRLCPAPIHRAPKDTVPDRVRPSTKNRYRSEERRVGKEGEGRKTEYT